MARLARSNRQSICLLEAMEGRELLSANHGFGGNAFGHGNGGGPAIATSAYFSHFQGASIAFSAAPAAVQAGLIDLAAANSLPAPVATQPVYLGNVGGAPIYSILLGSGGSSTKLTVDANGDPYVAPVRSTTTFGAIADADVTNEINAIAAALHLTAPATSALVQVSTPASGPAIYTITLRGSGWWYRSTTVSVDSDGNPVGEARLPFAALPTAIQNGLDAHTPAGATPLADTDLVTVHTAFGVTSYSATFRSPGVRTTVFVDAAGALAVQPSLSSVKFGDLPSAAQVSLQALATASGFTGTISATQNVAALDEANGTILYTLRVLGTSVNPAGHSHASPVTLTVDQMGNPTVAVSMWDGFGGCY